MIHTSKRPTPRCFYIITLSLFVSSLYITLSFGGLLPSFFVTTSKIYEEIYEADTLDFLIIGDWGNSGVGKDLKHGPQANVSKAMEYVANKHDSKFIVNVGDNFYKRSAKDYQGILSVNDSKWEEIWLKVYNSTNLRRLTWYTIAGNHDWYTNVTAQIDYSLTVNSRFFFPSLFYVRSTLFGKDLNLKAVWIHIDTNIFYYDVDSIVEIKMEGLKSNLLNFGFHTQQAVEEKFKWIEQSLIDNQDADYIFVIGHHPLIGICSQVNNMPRLLELFEKYYVSAYFSGHNHVLEYKSPTKSSPVAFFISGAGCKTGFGCEGKDWGMPRGAYGFVHANIKEETMDFEFVDATKLNKLSAGKIVYNGTINSRSYWYPKL